MIKKIEKTQMFYIDREREREGEGGRKRDINRFRFTKPKMSIYVNDNGNIFTTIVKNLFGVYIQRKKYI